MQTKTMSVIESVATVAIGFVIAVLSQQIIYPIYDFYPEWGVNLQIALIFTLISIVRSYYVRRMFNYIHTKRKT